jgi:hypothetical protein
MTAKQIQNKIIEKTEYLEILSKKHPSYRATKEEIKHLKNKLMDKLYKQENKFNK